MIQTGFEKRVTVQQVIESQLPEFVLAESPKTADFLKQYYISQEHQGGAADIAVNLDQYLKVDNLTPEVISGETTLYSDINTSDTTVQVYSTKGFPNEYGLFKIDSEIFTYTGLTTNTFTGVVRGFSGITSYRTDLNAEELVFSDTSSTSHTATTKVQNLSSLFLKDFYKKLKYTLTPGLEDVDFQSDLDVNNFIKEARSLYEAKGTKESFRILFNSLYGVEPTIVDLEQYLPKPSSAEFLRREVVVAERISGDPSNLIGQTIRKSTDDATQGSVSEVEVFTRSGISTYYKIGLFVGYSDNALIEGTFKVTPKTKVINPVNTGENIITVDSTVGFGATGTLVSGSNLITYTNKTVNQFLGCDGVTAGIGTGNEIRNNEVYIGYENGDLTKKVEIRISGVLSEFKTTTDILETLEGQVLYVKNVGEKIKNPESDPTDKQIFANSWIYNTSNRFDIDSIAGTTLNIKTDIDKSQLKKGDVINILLGDTENLAFEGAIIKSIDNILKQVQVDGLSGFTYDALQTYTFRRQLNTATSSGTSINYGQNKVTTDIQNVYNENDESFYVASNSLPSYDITKSTIKYSISTASSGSLGGYNSVIEKYQVINFNEADIDFLTGDEVYYKPETTELDGLTEGYYFVKVLSGGAIKLYQSRGLIDTDGSVIDGSVIDNALGFVANGTNNHSFILASQVNDSIHPQKLLKKFRHSQNIKTGDNIKTIPGSLGMLINGVEIVNYKSLDKIYYGPIDNITVYSGGKDYDVINPPSITVAAGSGSTAHVNAVVTGSVKEVFVDPQIFDVVDVKSATISGGNGSGAVLEPMVGVRQREIRFDSRPNVDGGGLSLSNNTVTFFEEHNLSDGEVLIYDSNGNGNIGIGTTALLDGEIYYPEIIDNKTIRCYSTKEHYDSKLNSVGMGTTGQGFHKFRKYDYTKTLRSIKVVDSGSGYTNRKLIVDPVGVSSISNTINFKNHGFNDGDKVVYSADTTAIEGLSISNQYQVIKLTNDSFKLANAGVGGTITTNYERGNYVSLASTGVGYQNFAYPDITLTIDAIIAGVGTATQSVGVITATPIIRGELIDAYLYDRGTGYGSTILNYNKTPIITIKSGKDAEFKPIIVDGKIDQVLVTYSGNEYTSPPDLTFTNVGSGIGAKARAIIDESTGKVTNAVVLNPGVNYDTNTTIASKSIGLNAYIDGDVRELTVNSFNRFGNEILTQSVGGLQYGYVGHSTAIGAALGDKLIEHSPILGWAYDGNPIYGPISYSDAKDENSNSRILTSGYVLATSDIVDRPSGFSDGFFVEDYKFNNSGDLDKHNGRYGKTPDFPNGVYAYYASVETISKEPKFPYYIGDTYRSDLIAQEIDQSFDFNNSDLIRNTLPYKSADSYADNTFIIEPYEAVQQRTIVDSVSKGSVDSFVINQPGEDYAVMDSLEFDNSGTNGGGLNAYVSEVEGKEIVNLNTEVLTYQSAKLIWNDSNKVSVHTSIDATTLSPTHTLLSGDNVVISGLSTFISGITKSHTIGVTSESVCLVGPMPVNPASGDVDDIYVSSIPSNISIGSTVAIGVTDQEIAQVLNVFDERKVIRILRGSTGSSHSTSSPVEKISDSFTIPIKTDYFESKLDNSVYFNPLEAVAIGSTTGGDAIRSYTIGDIQESVSIPYQSIYIPNHPFTQNQEVTFSRGSGAVIGVSRAPASSIINLPSSGTSQTMYVINKGKDFIGLTDVVGVNTNGMYFRSFGTNHKGNQDARDWKYSIESKFTQETARVEKLSATVSVSTSHLLSHGDIIRLSVKSNQSVGIGTSTAVRVKYNADNDVLITNPIIFSNTSVKNGNILELTDHKLKTGDKVFYSGSATGLSTNSYYVYRIDDNNIKLGQTIKDITKEIPTVVSIVVNTGGSGQELSRVNPRVNVVKNNNLVFDVADSSLSGYDFKIFYDNEFKNEIVSIGGTVTDFSVSSLGGAVGCGTTSTKTLNYDTTLPSKLYYTISKGGYISSSDTEVSNASEIIFIPSVYNNSYSIAGVGVTTFEISLKSLPESLSYNQTTTSLLEYSTPSTTARGGIRTIRATSGGLNYKKLPVLTKINSVSGKNADILSKSSSIGRIKETTIKDPGFDYSVDKTLSPEAFISPNITIIDRNALQSVDITSGGSDYMQAPDVVVVNPITGKRYGDGFLQAELQGSSVSKIDVLQSPKGLSDTINEVYTINNTNGIGISKVESTGISTAIFTLLTPVNNFTVQPFAVGDEVFVEGIQKLPGSSGTGLNSPDNGYKFFTVETVDASNPVKIGIGLTNVTTNAGLAVTDSNGYGLLVNKTKYPTFNVLQGPLDFIVDEQLYVLVGNTYSLQDLYITLSSNDQIKVSGTYEMKVNDNIRGKESGTIATIKEIVENKARFIIDYSLRQDYGWSDNIGKLNEDFQVLPDNDYYQNLSYTVKSPIEYEDLVNPVNRLLHTTGLKNFADTGITTATQIVSKTPTESGSVALIDIIAEKRVDTISNYDYGIDIDATANKSRYISFQNRKLSDYIDCKTNRVLAIDDISPLFNKADPAPNLYTNIDSISSGYNRYLIQAINPDKAEREITEVITLTNNSGDIFTFQKGSIGITTLPKIAEIIGDSSTGQLVFDPTDPYSNNYNIKTLKNTFITNNAGTGSQNFGFVTLSANNNNVGVGTTQTLFSATANANKGFFANVEVTDSIGDNSTYVELYVDQDGNDAYIADFYVDNKNQATGSFIGTFGTSIESGIVKINFYNTEANPVIVKSRVVGFGLTTAGEGTYRFLTSGQSAGTENTARYESRYAYTVSPATPVTVFSTPKSDVTSFKSVVKVGYGDTSSLHQLLSVHDGTDVYTTQFPFISIGSTSGIGTFGSQYSGSNIILKFYPDPGINNVVLVQAYSELLQTTTDLLNIPEDNQYGTINEEFIRSQYDGVNLGRINAKDFFLTYEGTPIFSKTFDPANTSSVNLSTGTFNIKNHFFESAEEITYSPVSTFSNITASAMVMSNGSVLPSTVYAIKINENEFQLATTAGIATAANPTPITFNTAGAGNAHELTMKNRAEKSIISLDGIVQNPVAYTSLSYTLTDNFGSISATDTYASLSGISSIIPGDILKIGDEFTNVKTVGLGTTASGPISNEGTFNLVELERGFIGTKAASHNDGGTARIYLGSFNIVNSKIHFTETPTGNNVILTDPKTLLDTPRSTFGGRVYLRKYYNTNKIYDDVSKSFTGIGATYTLTVEGSTTTGIETGSGMVFINNMFQTPTTANNSDNTYEFIDGNTSSKVEFTGITDSNNNLILSDYDVNRNQLPRGGMIVSLGSSLGVGYAQPVGASVTAILNTSGAITAVGIGSTDVNGAGYRGVVGIGVTDEAYEHRFVSASSGAVITGGIPLTPTGASYESHTGVLTLTIPSHGRNSGTIQLANNSIVFTCSRDNHRSEHSYPRTTDPAAQGNNLAITKIDNDTLSVNVGSGGGKGTGATVTATVGAGGTIIFGVSAGGSNYVNPRINVPSPSYNDLSVVGVSRFGEGMTTDTGKGLLLNVEVGPASPTPQNNKSGDTADLIDANNAFISEVAARRMFNRWNNGSNSSYNYPGGFTEADCIDDIEDVLEATAYNIKYAGNDKTWDAANLFVTGVYSTPPPVTGEEEQVIYALHEARDMAQRALRNEKIYTHLGAQYAHTYTSGTVAEAVVSGGNYAHTFVSAVANGINGSLAPNGATYNAVTGVLTLTFASAHGVANGGNVTIANRSLVFTCARDGHATQHAYPRASDPASGSTLTATLISPTSFSVPVGASPLVFKSVVAGSGAEATSYDAKTGDLVLNVGSNHGFLAPTSLNAPTAATYAPATGVLRITITGHGCSVGDYIKIDDNSIVFTCAKDNHATTHSYPLPRSSVSGTWLPIHQVSTNRIWVNVGKSSDTSAHLFVSATAGVKKANAGIGIGTSKLGFKCTRDATDANPGGVAQQLYPRPGDPFSWNKKQISIASTTTSSITVNVGVSSTSHTNLEQTFDNSITVDSADPKCATQASAVNTLVGIVTNVIKTHNSAQLPTKTVSSFETYEVKDFNISRTGYGFRKGDVFKPVGLVTDSSLSEAKSEFSLTVLETFNDSFSSWQFGELNYIDSISELQNGSRVRFPLKYQGSLLSFETAADSNIDLNSVLLIFVDGVIQDPNVHYTFDGGTSFRFVAPPSQGSSVSVFFYRGTRGEDSLLVDIGETIKIGDNLQLKATGDIPGQDERIVSNITESDVVQTNVYTGENIFDANNQADKDKYRLIDWTRQKVDQIIEGEKVYKSRDSIEGLVYPTARVIGDLPTTGISTVYVDDAHFFRYEKNQNNITINNISALIIQNQEPVAASITATVSAGGTVSALTVVSGGSGYIGSAVTVSISKPVGVAVTFTGGVGVYTGISTATIPVVNGSLSGTANIIDGGSGYNQTTPPLVLAPIETVPLDESLSGITTIHGFSGIITGIGTFHSGSDLFVKFHLHETDASQQINDTLEVGYPVYISDTKVGHGITSIDGHELSIVSVGTTFLDNVYNVFQYSRTGTTPNTVGLITCRVKTGSNVVGIATTSGKTGASWHGDIGKFSWGALEHNNPRTTSGVGIAVTGNILASGITSFPTIQRRGFGIRSNGALRKDLG